jgi:hypothetical protein
MANDCSWNEDPLRLVREGTSQDERAPAALAPASAPADARTAADDIVFAQGYAGLLKRYSAADVQVDDWRDYFGADLAVPLATAAIEDVDGYRTRVREFFDFLNNLDNAGAPAALKDRLGWLYTAAGAVAEALDGLQRSLPDEAPLKGVLANLIQAQLAPAFKRLVGYYKGGTGLGVVGVAVPVPELRVLRRLTRTFADLLAVGLSSLWSGGAAWDGYVSGIAADASVYGDGGAPDPFVRINHCATHNLFRSVFDQFLQGLAKTMNEAKAGLDDALENNPGHAPHYALYLAFLRLMAHARDAGNALTQKHLDFYYSTILGLKPRPAHPGHVHLLAELARQASQFDFTPGLRFKAGKDATGVPAFFANVADMVANKASVASLKTVYRHGAEPLASGEDDGGRVYAAPAADSSDGEGAPMAASDPSWHPFFNKHYVDGALAAIGMPKAQLGFAIASHYLLAAEGKRTIKVGLILHDALPLVGGRDFVPDLQCLLSTAKGWLAKAPTTAAMDGSKALRLSVELGGADDAIVPYAPKVHGYKFDTDLPLLLVLLQQDTQRHYAYGDLEDAILDKIELEVSVSGMRTLAAANDFGPVDLSKPFQPFGAVPVKGNALVVGSKEMFQKQLKVAQLQLQWQATPLAFSSAAQPLSAASVPTASIDFLNAGSWTAAGTGSVSIVPAAESEPVTFTLGADAGKAVLEGADLAPDEAYGTGSRHGFVRLRLDGDFGQDNYQKALIAFLRKDKVNGKDAPDPGPRPPQGPVATALTMTYTADTTLVLSSAVKTAFLARAGRFFHVAPFGTAERHAWLSGGAPVPLLPPLRFARGGAMLASEAEFYIGIAGLAPPQNLSLLFQVADGTANPLARKPPAHIDWSYLENDQWVPFPPAAVVDATGGLLDSGIVTFAVPREATGDNRLLPAGQYWIRAAVHEASDAVCRLRLVAAQALEAVFTDQGNAPEFSAAPLPPGSVTQLAMPDAAVKRIAQPYPSFGGRGAERMPDFYRRVSERLRHKDRAIDLWDYERLVLEAFPQIYKVKCLNHTQYEPADGAAAGPCSGGIYRELAPGHVTLVALPDLRAQRQRDPLKPYTSLGLLGEIEAYLARRCGGFVKLHVKNPQFEEVRVSFALKLRDGYDEAYSTTQLQAAITRFLSPWAFDGTGAPAFGGRIHKSALIHFVESQDCVDYVTDFRLFQDIPCKPPGSVDLDEAVGSRALSILVSAPKHQITVIRPEADQALAESCGCDG